MAKDFEEPTTEEISIFQTLSPEQQASLAAINPEGAAAASYQLPYQDNAWSLGSPEWNYETESYDTPGIVWTGTGPAPTDGEGIGDLFAGSPIAPTGITERPDGSWVSDDNGIPLEVTDGYTGSDGSLSLGGPTGLPQVPTPWEGNPSTPATPWEGNPYQPVDAGGVQGVGGTNPSGSLQDLLDGLAPEKTGYESSSNKDFYQQQMQEMRATQKGQKLNELAAAMRRQEASNAPPEQAFGGDPWSWANLPEVQMGGSVAATPIEWGLNDAYGITQDMTNRQAVGALSPVLNTDEMAIMNAHWADSPPSSTNNNWLTSNPQALSAQFSANASDTVSPEFTNVMQKIFNNLYTQTGGGTGGISVPDGYANPVNTQGV